jgi:ribosomal protein S18 acetylase RimI-like enzyme
MKEDRSITYASLDAGQIEGRLPELAALLHACVLAHASIGFVLPFTIEHAAAFWTDQVLPAVRHGTRAVLAAECSGRIAGSVQLDWDTPANQPHRADVRKLLVDPAWRRRGMARALMVEIERFALARERTLLTLDTRTGDHAEPLYASLGYTTVGVIPGYCVDPARTRLDATTLMYKTLTHLAEPV